MLNVSNACSIFRAWQGWTSLSSTGPNEGTLRVLPMLSLSTAYIILRPFFRPKNPHFTSLKFEDWEVDLDGPRFPGSSIGKTQELNERTHPHLRLGRTMVSVPRVEPGDQVYCGYLFFFSFFWCPVTDLVEKGTVMSFMQWRLNIRDRAILRFCIFLPCR